MSPKEDGHVALRLHSCSVAVVRSRCSVRLLVGAASSVAGCLACLRSSPATSDLFGMPVFSLSAIPDAQSCKNVDKPCAASASLLRSYGGLVVRSAPIITWPFT